ncbi:MAG TPA: TIGR01777 family oxidoreductase [Streptosporangiaceae bacterium]|nr:TIGR01777 family oxidoreductase [Streptosporangiaceae bacterium]
MRVAITGSTGLIGAALARDLLAGGSDVIRLVRRDPASAEEMRWDPSAGNAGLSPDALDGVDAVVHLSGAPVAGGRWTPARKEELRTSRIGSTSAIIAAMLAAPKPPPVLIAGSAVGWYGDTGTEAVDETAPNGSGFLAMLVRDWEAATAPASAAGVRVANVRSGIVLSSRGGMLPRLLLPFRLGLGAEFGDGRQYISWITLADHISAVRFLLDRSDLSGPVNLTSPEPATNSELTKALAANLHRPAMLTVPAAILRLALGEVSTELLKSCRALPARLEQAGFAFRQPAIGPALAAAAADKTSG